MNNSSRKTTVFKLMIGVFVALLLIGFGWSRYSRPDAGSASSVATDAVEAGGEDQVKSLIVRMYKWKDANLTDGDFMPVTNAEGSKYVGIDFGKHTARLDVLRRTAFFTDELLGSYDDIAKAIDKKLKNGEYLWPAGEQPPFSTGADFWCGCEDYPSDNPWDNIVITIDAIDDKNASLTWRFSESGVDSGYRIKAAKADGIWKIQYMQGFDINSYL